MCAIFLPLLHRSIEQWIDGLVSSFLNMQITLVTVQLILGWLHFIRSVHYWIKIHFKGIYNFLHFKGVYIQKTKKNYLNTTQVHFCRCIWNTKYNWGFKRLKYMCVVIRNTSKNFSLCDQILRHGHHIYDLSENTTRSIWNKIKIHTLKCISNTKYIHYSKYVFEILVFQTPQHWLPAHTASPLSIVSSILLYVV